MARPSQSTDKRRELLPIVARAFAELGYRRATTAELARRCGVQENILYRLWPDKKAMFIAAIEFVYTLSAATWERLLHSAAPAGSAARRLLSYEAEHHGEFGHYRIVFAGLNETDDPEIRAALAAMYQRFGRFLAAQIAAYRGDAAGGPSAADRAWGVIGLGTVANIARELGLISTRQRRTLMMVLGTLLLEGGTEPAGPGAGGAAAEPPHGDAPTETRGRRPRRRPTGRSR